MNIDRKLCARAFDKAGEQPITEEEWGEIPEGNRVRLIKDIYHSTILEALAGTEWTSQKKRAKLVISEDENLTEYNYAYILPKDCAKPCALFDEGKYIVEGNILYTNSFDAILIYVTNGFTGEYKYEYTQAEPQPTAETFAEGVYYVKNEEEYVIAEDYQEGITYYTREILEEDYPLYDDYNFDPLLAEYIETLLACKIIFKITGDMNKYQLLYSEARLMENRATKASIAHGHNKDKGNPYWGEQLGLPNYGGN